MRLICPNCSAQYEVPPEAVPLSGRDVQCSACGHTWFEVPGTLAASSKDAGPAAAPVSEPVPEPARDEPWDRVPVVTDDDEEFDDIEEVRVAPPPLPSQRPSVSPEIADILRSEAALEVEARAAEDADRLAPMAPLATISDRPGPTAIPRSLPLQEVAPRPTVVESASSRPARPARPAELDVAQVNAALRTSNDRAAARSTPVAAPRRRSGFGAGVWGALLVIALLALLYALRPQIVAALPQAAAVLDPYAAAVDRGRDWLDGQVQGFLSGNLPSEAEAPAAE